MSKYPKGANGSGSPLRPSELTNGHTKLVKVDGIAKETPIESTASSTSSGYGSPTSCSCADEASRHHPHVNGGCGHTHIQLIFKDNKTSPIVKRVFYTLLTNANIDRSVTKCFEMSEHTLRRTQGAHIVRKAADLTCEYIQISEHTLDSLVQDFSNGIIWEIQPMNMQPEYRRVVDSMFSDGVTWGRVVSFLRFAVAYGIYVHRRGMTRAVESIQAWTVEVIEEDLGSFFRENNGWEGYTDYVEASVRAQKKILQTHRAHHNNQADKQDPGFWQGVYAVGAVAVGAAAAFTLTKAFS